MADGKIFGDKTDEERLADLQPEPAELEKMQELKLNPEFESVAPEMCIRFLRARECDVREARPTAIPTLDLRSLANRPKSFDSSE